VYRIDDDVFLDRVVRRRPERVEVTWRGETYSADVPDLPLPLFLTLEGLREPPPGEAILVLRTRLGLRHLFRATSPPSRASARVRRISDRAP
jgi:hypothetical protein